MELCTYDCFLYNCARSPQSIIKETLSFLVVTAYLHYTFCIHNFTNS